MRKYAVSGKSAPAGAGMFLFLACVLFLPLESFGGHHEGERYDSLNGYGERHELISSDEDGGDMGTVVAISGDVAVVGSYDNSVYVFERDSDGAWSQSQKFSSSVADTNFGGTVAVSGDTIVVGAYYEESVYIYERSTNGVWLQSQKLTSGSTDTGFGVAAAVSGDKVIVGASFEDSAYIYEKDANGTWVLKQKITVSSPATPRAFGYSVAISGDRAVVGAPDTTKSTFCEDGADAAYVYERNAAGAWLQSQILTTGGENMRCLIYFGQGVGISGDSLIVGSITTSHVYERNTEGNYVLTLTTSHTSAPGYLVAISGDKALWGPQNSTRIRVMKKAADAQGQYWQIFAWVLHMRDLEPDPDSARLSKKYRVADAGISGDRVIVGFWNHSSDDERIFVYELTEAGTVQSQPVVNEQGPDAGTEPSSPGGEEQPGADAEETGTPADGGGQGPNDDAGQTGSVVVIEETHASDDLGIVGSGGDAGDGLPQRSASGGCAISGENRFAQAAFLAAALTPLLFFGRFRRRGKRFPPEKRAFPPG